MSGLYLILFAIGVLGILQYMNMHSMIPARKKTVAFIGVVCLLIGLWGGGAGPLAGIGQEEEQAAAPTIQVFETTASAGTNIDTYDKAEKTFQVTYYENTTSGKVYADSGYTTELTTVDFTLTILNNSADDDLANLSSSYDTWTTGGTDYTPVVELGTGEDNIGFTPSGGARRLESAKVLVNAGSSKDVTVDVEPWDAALGSLNNFETKNVYVNAPDAQYTIEFLKAGESA